MSHQITALLEQRARLVAEQRALLDSAGSDTLTVEQQTAYDQRSEQIDSLRSRADQLTQLDAERRDLDAALAAYRGAPAAVDPAALSLRSMLTGGMADATGRTVNSLELAPLSAEQRALSKGTSSAGGATVPTTMYSALMEHMVETSAVLSAGPTLITTTSGEPITVPTTTGFSAGALVAEGATIGSSDPSFASRPLGAYKYGVLVTMSTELLADSAFDIESFVARQAGRALGIGAGAHYVTGTGSSQPTGIVTSAPTGVTGGTGVAGAPTFDNLIDLQHSVIAPYRNSPSAAWMMKDSTAAVVRKIKDTEGQYLWQPSVTLGVPDTLLGRPVYTDPAVAGTGLSAKSVVFGDFSAYAVRMAGGIRVERSVDAAFDTDQVKIRVIVRTDGLTIDQTGALKVFVGGAS